MPEDVSLPSAPVMDTSAASGLPKVPLNVKPASSASVSGRIAQTTVKDVIYWKNVKVTGTLFALGNLFFFLTLVSKYTFLRVAATFTFLYFCLGFAIVNGSKAAVGFVGENAVPRPTLGGSYINKASIQEHIDDVLFLINSGIDEIKKALYCVDNVFTLKLIGFFFALSLVGRIFPDLVLAYLIFLALFLGPITYEKNQEKIDEYIDKARKEAAVHYEKGMVVAKEKAGKLKDTIAEKGTPLLEKNPRLREMAERAGFTPQKKTM